MKVHEQYCTSLEGSRFRPFSASNLPNIQVGNEAMGEQNHGTRTYTVCGLIQVSYGIEVPWGRCEVVFTKPNKELRLPVKVRSIT